MHGISIICALHIKMFEKFPAWSRPGYNSDTFTLGGSWSCGRLMTRQGEVIFVEGGCFRLRLRLSPFASCCAWLYIVARVRECVVLIDSSAIIDHRWQRSSRNEISMIFGPKFRLGPAYITDIFLGLNYIRPLL